MGNKHDQRSFGDILGSILKLVLKATFKLFLYVFLAAAKLIVTILQNLIEFIESRIE